MSNISSDSGSPVASAFCTANSIERSKYLRLPRPVRGSVRLSARIASRLCCRLLISDFDSVSRSSSALLVSRISRVDFTDHAGADLVDAVGGLDVGKIRFVDLLEVGFGQLAVARQGLVDDLVER